MSNKQRITVAKGDGIGPEIMKDKKCMVMYFGRWNSSREYFQIRFK
jgi:isocitrate/isopropylmalate dehydrogenase